MISNFSLIRKLTPSFKSKAYAGLKMKYSFRKLFSEKTKLFLNEDEAYIMNEHDRMLIQLNSNTVPLTVMPKFMKELTEYCFQLSKYKQFIKGWSYISKFFSENLKNFSNEELFFYISIFSFTKYLGNNYPQFWVDISNEVLSRNLDKESFLQFLRALSLVGFEDQEIMSKLVSKLGDFTLSYTESLKVGVYLGILNYNKSDPIWEKLLSAVENKEIALEKAQPTNLFSFASFVKENVTRDSPFYKKVASYYQNNFNDFHPENAYICNTQYVELTNPSTEDLADLILETVKKSVHATEFSRFQYYNKILGWCAQFPTLLNALEARKSSFPGNFVLPSSKFVEEFNIFNSKSQTYGNIQTSELRELSNKFWAKNADKLGFKASFAGESYVSGPFNYETLTQRQDNLGKRY